MRKTTVAAALAAAAILIVIALRLLLPGPAGDEAGPVSKTFVAMGSPCRMTVWAHPQGREAAERAVLRAQEAVEAVDAALSLYRDDSEIVRVNREAAEREVEVSPLFADCLAAALEAERVSDGLFDPLLKPVLDLWGFEPGTGPKHVPPPEALAKALTLCDSGLLVFDRAARTVRFRKPGMGLDLNGIAQGFATERAAAALRKAGVKSALVESGGGEFEAIGSKPEGAPFRVGIRKPSRGSADLVGIVEISSVALATSGDYEKYFVFDGERYSHLIDPRTGFAKGVPPCSVTVLGPSCSRCDALATACAVLDAGEAVRFIETLDGYEVIIAVQGKDGPVWFKSSGVQGEAPLFRLLRGRGEN